MKPWVTRLPWPELREASEENNIPIKLLAAICFAESGGVTLRTRYEPNYIYLFKPKNYADDLGISLVTEEIMQKTSWGLCQVMGGNARENGFNGYLNELCNPIVGLKYACVYIKKLAAKYSTESDIVAAYNAGSVVKTANGLYKNEGYVNKVVGLLRDLEEIRL